MAVGASAAQSAQQHDERAKWAAEREKVSVCGHVRGAYICALV
jgi:hypothetical protein